MSEQDDLREAMDRCEQAFIENREFGVQELLFWQQIVKEAMVQEPPQEGKLDETKRR